MNELLFPVVGSMLVFFGLVPLLSLAAHAVIALLPQAGNRVVAQERPWRFLLVIVPTLGPVVWLISAAIHQSEEGAPLAACVVDHLGGELCHDVVLFGLVLFTVLGQGVFRRFRGERAATQQSLVTPAELARANERIQSMCRTSSALARYSGRIWAVGSGLAPACTRGLFRPRIEVEVALALQLDDAELKATLLHETEHIQALDPLRFFAGQVALSINPLGRLLAAELARYHFAREALCDMRAVQRGADPLALARSIVAVAAPEGAPASVAALGGHGIGGVRLRVHLLLGYATRPLGPARRRAPLGVVSSIVLLLVISPHLMGGDLFDTFHNGIERTALLLGVG